MNRLLMGSQRLLFPFVLLLLCSCVQLSKPSSPQWSLSAPPKFVVVAKGTYVWGSPKSEEGHQPAEAQQSVEITKGFEVSTTEVTQLQWFEVMGNNPSKFSTNAVCPRTYQEIDGVGVCGDFPVEQVSWVDIQEFLSRLNHLIRDGYHYRLPTEAEWEYFARANTTTAYSFGDSPEPGMDYGWFKENSPNELRP